MTVEKNNIQSLKDVITSITELSVYDLDVYSAIELYYNVAKKLNEVISDLSIFENAVSNDVIEQHKLLEELINGGVTTEFINKLNEMIANGTISDIIEKTLDNKSYYINPKEFNAVGDGITDDTQAIQQCIEYAENNGYMIKFESEKTYLISSELIISNRLNIDFNNSTLKMNDNHAKIDSVIKVDVTNTDSQELGYIYNLNIDCNKNADIGLNIVFGKKGKIENIEVKNSSSKGFYIGSAHELSVIDIRGQYCPILLTIDSTDVNFRGVYGRYCNIGIQNKGSSNYYTDIHLWNNEETYLNSVFFEIYASCVINNGYSDTYETSFKYYNRASLILNNCKFYWNTKMVNITSSPYLFNFQDVPNASDTLKIKNSFIDGVSNTIHSIFSKQNVIYNLKCRVDESNSVYKCDNVPTSISSPVSIINSDYSILSQKINKKDGRVVIKLRIKRVGTFYKNTSYDILKIEDNELKPTETQVISIIYGIDDEYGVNGTVFGRLLSNGTLKITTPNEESNDSSSLYYYVDLIYDMEV